MGTQSNRSAIGARVKVKSGSRVQVQELQSQSSYYSVNDFRLHYGLGEAARADVIEIRWPTDRIEILENVDSDQVVYIKEGSGIVSSDKLGGR